MAKKKEEVTKNKSVVVRAQTEDEIRGRLKKQGKIKETPKKKEGGVREMGEEESLTRIEDRKDRVAREAGEENPIVRLMTKKDVTLRQAKEKERAENGDDKNKPGRVQTKEDITARNDQDQTEEPEELEEPEEPGELEESEQKEDSDSVEFFAKDIVSFKNDDGIIVTGKIKRVTPKNKAIIDTKDAVYTVPCDILTKKEGEEK